MVGGGKLLHSLGHGIHQFGLAIWLHAVGATTCLLAPCDPHVSSGTCSLPCLGVFFLFFFL